MSRRIRALDKKTYLLVDVSNFVYKNYYAVKAAHGDNVERSRVIFYFLIDIIHLKEKFKNSFPVFCFDSDTSIRKRIQKKYKIGRARTPDKVIIEKYIDYIRLKVLPSMGFKNLRRRKDLEADDVIANITIGNKCRERLMIICSGDSDMYQLLKKNVVIYNPNKRQVITKRWFRQTYNKMQPKDWAMVKCLVGKKDEVEGIPGVGIKNAVKFLTGCQVSEKIKLSITDNEKKIINMLNMAKLPIVNLNERNVFRKDLVTEKKIKYTFDKCDISKYLDNGYLSYIIKLLEKEAK